jgi:hypothetical protein
MHFTDDKTESLICSFPKKNPGSTSIPQSERRLSLRWLLAGSNPKKEGILEISSILLINRDIFVLDASAEKLCK